MSNAAEEQDTTSHACEEKEQASRVSTDRTYPEELEEHDDDDDATNANTISDEQQQEQLDPPVSRGERLRDFLLRSLDLPFFQILGIIVMILVIADGALFFFFLMGWQSLCNQPTRADCEPRNWIYNFSVQFLNVLFTYMVTVSMPWRCANAIHTFGWGCPYREHRPGHDLYGKPTNDVWFHIPLCHRSGIIVFLLLNCLTQYANQVTRIMFSTYNEQNVVPGNIWTNVFFGSSMLCAAVGGGWMGIVSEQIRKAHPGKFRPGPLQVIQKYYRAACGYCCCCCNQKPTDDDDDDDDAQQHEGENVQQDVEAQIMNEPSEVIPEQEDDDIFDPTHRGSSFNVIGGSRAELRMFGM